MLYSFQVYSKVNLLYKYIYPLFFLFFSHISHYRVKKKKVSIYCLINVCGQESAVSLSWCLWLRGSWRVAVKLWTQTEIWGGGIHFPAYSSGEWQTSPSSYGLPPQGSLTPWQLAFPRTHKLKRVLKPEVTVFFAVWSQKWHFHILHILFFRRKSGKSHSGKEAYTEHEQEGPS